MTPFSWAGVYLVTVNSETFPIPFSSNPCIISHQNDPPIESLVSSSLGIHHTVFFTTLARSWALSQIARVNYKSSNAPILGVSPASGVHGTGPML